MKPAPFLPLLAALGIFSTVSTASAAWVRLPGDPVRPVNLANDRIPDTTVSSSKGIGQASNLITEDPTLFAQIPAGNSSATIRLHNQQSVNLIALSNGGVSGVVNVSASSDNENWTPLSQIALSANEAAVSARFSPIQVRYLRFDFNASNGGAINNISIIGAAKAGPASKKASKSDDKSQGNLACAIGGARPIYVNPTPVNLGSMEFDVNILRFPQSKQNAQTVIYDLGNPQPLNDIAIAYDLRPTRTDLYAFDQLPEKKDWRGKLTLDPSFLDSATPIAVGIDSKGIGRIKVKPKAPLQTKYVVIRVQPLSQTSGLQGVLENVASEFGFDAALPIASPAGGSTISSVFINAPFSISSFRQALANALNGSNSNSDSNGDGEGQGGQPSGSSNDDKADATRLIPPHFLGQYDYRINGGVGGGTNKTAESGSSSSQKPPVTTVVRPIIRPTVPNDDQSVVDP